jgi:DNA-binding SARP family transcriptional activator
MTSWPPATGTTIAIVNGFSVRHRQTRARSAASPPLPIPSQRVLAFLATEGRPRARNHVAFTLWPEASDERASQSLRTALWSVHDRLPGVVEIRGGQLALSPNVRVDLADLRATARTLPDMTGAPGLEQLVDRFAHEVLPDWYDDWLLVVRERWREVRLHALDLLSDRLSAAGHHAAAIDAAVASVAIEPLRETGRRVLINAYLAEGNVARAVKELETFRGVLSRELGIEPSPDLQALVRRAKGVVA